MWSGSHYLITVKFYHTQFLLRAYCINYVYYVLFLTLYFPIENIGKTVKSVSTGPVKPNEPVKKAGEIKKSFLSKKGTALRDIQTPQKPLTPRSKNIEASAKKMFCSPFIYNDENENNENIQKHLEEMEFTKPTYKCSKFGLYLFFYFI